MPDSPERLHAIVTGTVQGVNFRYATRTEAARLGVTGWVRNQRDSSVEITAEGSHAALEALLKFLQHGPPAAEVAQVKSEWLAATGEFRQFEVWW